ncbi:hypothetical protein CMUS01_09982 [Colletotrichum musicola]|uniref:Uncharacterized protein n=1 Tax=Colletotrichum musicola TaxID=2175873 RepID=A0A8H6K4R1_9PEZI|nr:hypothetical protein CMUS01_09982 [Colletotrichum musicola]
MYTNDDREEGGMGKGGGKWEAGKEDGKARSQVMHAANKKHDKTSKHKRNKVTPEVVDWARVRKWCQNQDEATTPRTPYLDRAKVVCYSKLLSRRLFLNLLATHTKRCHQAHHPPPGVVKIEIKSATDRKTDEANKAHANAEVSTEQRQTWLYCESGQPGGSMTLTKHATDLLKELFKEAS